MLIAFGYLAYRDGYKQALYDLLAFNLLFGFHFAGFVPGGLSIRVIHVLLIVILMYQVLRIILLGKIRMSPALRIVLPVVGIYLLWVVAVSFYHRIPQFGFGSALSYAIITHLLSVAFFVVGIRLAHDQAGARFLRIIVGGSVLVAAIALIQFASTGRWLTSDGSDYYLGLLQPLGANALERREASESALRLSEAVRLIQLGNQRFYRAPGSFDGASNLLMMVGLVLATLFITSSRLVKSWMLPAFLLIVLGFMVAFNRTVIATFIGLALLVFLYQVRFGLRLPVRLVRGLLIGGSLLTIVGLVALLVYSPLQQAVQLVWDIFFGTRAARDFDSLNGRTELWGYVLNEIRLHPWLGNDQPITAVRAGWGTDPNDQVDVGAHNIFFDLAFRNGVMAAVAFAGLFGFSFWRMYRLARDPGLTTEMRKVFLALLVALLGFLAVNLMSAPLRNPSLAAFFWIWLGYLAAFQPRSVPVPVTQPMGVSPHVRLSATPASD
ncbi:MAG: O-antigen ligase family protein [Oscillochloridaceae bacterium umkhey_bin13]